jgi:hypothetical protein
LRFARELALAAPPDAAWRALAALAPVRGSAAGFEGTAALVDADDDERMATLRLVGAAGPATVAVTATVAVRDALLAVSADVVHGPGGAPVDEAAADEALGHLATTLAFALATADRPRRAWDASVPPTPMPTPTAWDAPSPPPARAPREPIPASATLTLAAPAEVLTPRRRDVFAPGEEPTEPERRWMKAGVAAAAGIAALRILRRRR